jgi:hypothetical protein
MKSMSLVLVMSCLSLYSQDIDFSYGKTNQQRPYLIE